MEPTREEMQELECLARCMARDSCWQLTEAAFRLGLRLGAERVRTEALRGRVSVYADEGDDEE